eukprot:29008-Pelagococcus_subviridis.AAC.1
MIGRGGRATGRLLRRAPRGRRARLLGMGDSKATILLLHALRFGGIRADKLLQLGAHTLEALVQKRAAVELGDEPKRMDRLPSLSPQVGRVPPRLDRVHVPLRGRDRRVPPPVHARQRLRELEFPPGGGEHEHDFLCDEIPSHARHLTRQLIPPVVVDRHRERVELLRGVDRQGDVLTSHRRRRSPGRRRERSPAGVAHRLGRFGHTAHLRVRVDDVRHVLRDHHTRGALDRRREMRPARR